MLIGSMHQADQMEKDKLNKGLGAGTKERKRKRETGRNRCSMRCSELACAVWHTCL